MPAALLFVHLFQDNYERMQVLVKELRNKISTILQGKFILSF